MFYKLKSNILFRNYGAFGYITDNRNYGYYLTSHGENFIGDKILSKSGSEFISVLNSVPKHLDEVALKIHKIYPSISINIIKDDAMSFYSAIEQDGFIVSGKTFQSCMDNDERFSYKQSNKQVFKENITSKIEVITTTQSFFEEYFNGQPRLSNVHIEIISQCNERCIHCYIPHDYKNSIMEPAMFFDILEQCKEMNVLHLTISGGEPLLHRNFCDFLTKCKELNFSVNVLSNLTLLNDYIISVMKDNPLLCVQASLYSMNPTIHDKITKVKGSYNKTIRAIEKLIENDIPIQISCPITKINKDCYPEVRNWAKKFNIHVGEDFAIIGSYNHSSKNLNCRLTIDDIKDIINEYIKFDLNYLEQIKSEAKRKQNIILSDNVCNVCQSSICISEKGNVYPCAGWQDFIVGNLNTKSIKDIWLNSNEVKYLRNLKNKDFSKCINCNDREFCTMCLVRNANENASGNPLIVNDFFCKVGNYHKEICNALL